MASVLDQLPQSNFSLVGNGFGAQPGSAAWGFPDWTYNNGDLDPDLSDLHWDYSYLNDPDDIEIEDFNRQALGGNVYAGLPTPATLDETDPIAPNNWQAGGGGVVSQIYKSTPGRNYKDLGPQPGRY
jgi:hypothetical protein